MQGWKKCRSCYRKVYVVEKPTLTQIGRKENGVELKWEMLDDATGYTIKRKYGKDGTYTLIKNLDKQCGEYIDTTVWQDIDEPAFYRVQAYKFIDGVIFYSLQNPAGSYSSALKIESE